jgi:DNA-binding GntR family transcriptional regulator
MTDRTRLISFTELGGEVTAPLREDILLGRYKDGEHLAERDISDEVRC